MRLAGWRVPPGGKAASNAPGNEPRGQACQGPVGQVGGYLLHLGMIAVVFLHLEGLERGVGEHRVVAPGAEQLALARGGAAVKVFDPADDHPGSNRLPLFEAKTV